VRKIKHLISSDLSCGAEAYQITVGAMRSRGLDHRIVST